MTELQNTMAWLKKNHTLADEAWWYWINRHEYKPIWIALTETENAPPVSQRGAPRDRGSGE